MESLLEEIKGNPLRIIKFLGDHTKESTFATRGHIVARLYVRDRLVETESKPDDDIDFLISKNLVEREDKNLWLSDFGVIQYSRYKKIETDLILKDIINAGYEFALLKYLDTRNEFVNINEFPKILEDFAPFLSNFNQPSGMLIDNLFKLKNYTIEKNNWYKLNDFGIQYLTVLISKQKEDKLKRNLEDILLKETISSTRFQRNVTYASLAIALFAGLIPLFIYLADGNKKIDGGLPEMQQILKNQKSLQQNNIKIQKALEYKDTSILKVKIK